MTCTVGTKNCVATEVVTALNKGRTGSGSLTGSNDIALTNVFVPQLETVAESHNVSLSPQDSPSLQASKRIGKVFGEFDSNSSAMIVLEGDQPLGSDAHHYYDGLVQKLSQNPRGTLAVSRQAMKTRGTQTALQAPPGGLRRRQFHG